MTDQDPLAEVESPDFVPDLDGEAEVDENEGWVVHDYEPALDYVSREEEELAEPSEDITHPEGSENE